jgi:hypothetical protein
VYSTQHYQEYLKNRNQWTDTTIDLIDWETYGNSIRQYTSTKLIFITKLTHNWLPTLHHPSHRYMHQITTCPCCKLDNETNQHFLTCTETVNHIETVLIPQLIQQNRTEPPSLINLLTAAIHPINMNLIVLTDHPPSTHRIIESQSQIGWDNTLKGRWSTSWVELYNRLTNTKNGVKWTVKNLKLIWNELHQKWLNRCNKLHDDSKFEKQRTATTFAEEINTMGEQIAILPPTQRIPVVTSIVDTDVSTNIIQLQKN